MPGSRLIERTLLCCSLVAAACESRVEQAPRAAPAASEGALAEQAEPPEQASDTPRDTPAARESKLPRKSPAQLRQLATRISVLLDEGRTLARRSKLAPATNKYYELLRIAPHYRPALRELAWAEFRLGRLRSAWAHSRRALVDAEQSAQPSGQLSGQLSGQQERAQLLYYLGRIAALRKQPTLAALHYQRALALEPSDSVSTHLERLELAPERLPELPPLREAPQLPGLPIIAEGLPDGEAVCARLEHADVCDIAECSFTNSLAGTDASWDMLVVADQYGLGRCYHPVVETSAGWTLFGAALHESAGEEVARALGPVQARVDAGASAPLLVFEWSEQRHARDWNSALADETQATPELPADEVERRSGLIFCQRVEERARCTAAIPLQVEGWRDARARRYAADPSVHETGLELSGVTRAGPTRSAELDDGLYLWPVLEPKLD